MRRSQGVRLVLAALCMLFALTAGTSPSLNSRHDDPTDLLDLADHFDVTFEDNENDPDDDHVAFADDVILASLAAVGCPYLWKWF